MEGAVAGEKGRPKADGVDNSFGGNDPRQIDLTSAVECAYWMKALDTSEAQLRAAIETVGVSAQKVKDYLKQSR